MKKFLFISVLLMGFIFVPTTFAVGGVCSNHDGIDCLAGPDSDGSVICGDGWTGSSGDYRDIRYVCTDNFKPFIDVDQTHPNNEAIVTMYEKAIIIGYPDLTFKPDNEINRVEFLKILVEGSGLTPDVSEYNNCFPDVKEEWFAPYVCYAKGMGWVEGYEDDTFRPVNTVNKVEAIKMLMVTQGFEVPESVATDPFNDVSSKAWYAPYVSVAKDKGLLEETGDLLNPGDMMKRAGIAEMTYRAIVVKEEDYEAGYDWAVENDINNFEDCENLYGIGAFEDGCNLYVQENYYEGETIFKGYECTEDCAGHEAGYDWAVENGITNKLNCLDEQGGYISNSRAFTEGCWAWVDEN